MDITTERWQLAHWSCPSHLSHFDCQNSPPPTLISGFSLNSHLAPPRNPFPCNALRGGCLFHPPPGGYVFAPHVLLCHCFFTTLYHPTTTTRFSHAALSPHFQDHWAPGILPYSSKTLVHSLFYLKSHATFLSQPFIYRHCQHFSLCLNSIWTSKLLESSRLLENFTGTSNFIGTFRFSLWLNTSVHIRPVVHNFSHSSPLS